jgi:hypothetical protein
MYNHQNQLELTFVVVQILDQLISQNDEGGGGSDDDNNNNNNKVLRTNSKI